jgi:REP element-mobilizing transposase RayT
MGLQYQVVFISKYRKKVIFSVIKKLLGEVFHELARRRENKIEEGHLMSDHVHILISIPSKYSVAEVIGFIEGKSSIWIAQNVERKARNFNGNTCRSTSRCQRSAAASVTFDVGRDGLNRQFVRHAKNASSE